MNLNRCFVMMCLIASGWSHVAFAADARDALIDAQTKTGEKVNAEQGSSLSDGKGRVYQIDGTATMTRQGSPVEEKLKVGDLVKVGDTISTNEKSSVSIAFDYLKKNAVHIPAESKAVFDSIEPNDIKLENGSIFNAVDGLTAGSSWKVTTPVAVAAVRGTVYLVRFESATGQFYAATVDVPDDGKTSAIEIQLVDSDGSANVPEGKEISLKEGEAPSSDMVQDLSPEAVAEIQQFFEQLKNERESIEENIEQQASDMADGEMPNEESAESTESEEIAESTESTESMGDEGASEDSSMAENSNEDLGDKGFEGDSSFTDFESGPSGMDMMESTESPISDMMPEFDSSEDFKDQLGQDELEENESDEQDYPVEGTA